MEREIYPSIVVVAYCPKHAATLRIIPERPRYKRSKLVVDSRLWEWNQKHSGCEGVLIRQEKL